MQTTVRQTIGNQTYRYPKIEIKDAKKMQPNYVEHSIDRDEVLQNIAFLTQYMEDLKAGKPVENICENDSWYLEPENIAQMIECDKTLLKQGVKFREIDPDNIWECIK